MLSFDDEEDAVKVRLSGDETKLPREVERGPRFGDRLVGLKRGEALKSRLDELLG